MIRCRSRFPLDPRNGRHRNTIALHRSSQMSSRYRQLDSRRLHLETFSREVLGQIDTYLSMGSIQHRCNLQLDCLTRNREEIFQQGRLGRKFVSNCLHIDERELEGHQLVGRARGCHLGGKLGIETLSREQKFAQNASCWLVGRIKGVKSTRNVLECRQNNPKERYYRPLSFSKHTASI
jgi:hypothetical protein